MLARIGTYVRRNHLALLALFFALGGASFAAGGKLLPKNSVGTKQVINESLQAKDLSKKARAALRGTRGQRGPTGANGATGAQGAPGPATEAYEKREEGDVDVTTLSNGSLVLNVPSGSYVVTGNVEQENRDFSNAADLYCTLGVDFPNSVLSLDQTDTTALAPKLTYYSGEAANVVHGSFTSPDPAVITYTCHGGAFAKAMWIRNPSLSAIRVAAVH